MKPDSKGSLVDTDVEIDLELSEEFLAHQQQQQQVEPASARTVGRASPADSASSAASASAAPTPGSMGAGSVGGASAGQGYRTSSPAMSGVFRSLNESTSAGNTASATNSDGNANTTDSVVTALAQYLLPEPSVQEKETVAVKIKLPNGLTQMRRFAHTSEVRQLFLFIAIEVARAGVPVHNADALLGSLQVSTRFPARTLRFSEVLNGSEAVTHKTFVDIGMNVTSEAVFVTQV